MQFVVVLEQEQRRRIGEIYARAYALYRASEGYLGKVEKGEAERDAQQQRTAGSADHLGDHMGDAPALVLACCRGRADDNPAAQTALLGSVLPGHLVVHARCATARTWAHAGRRSG